MRRSYVGPSGPGAGMRIIALACLFVMLVQAASAACYTPAQFRAEQAVRYHTRLMVLGMLCQGAYKQNAYADYQAFTKRNQNIIREQENILIGYYKQIKKPAPERALHSFRTDLANKTSTQASMSGGQYCRQYEKEWLAAKNMQPAQFKAWIVTLDPQKPQETSTPGCAVQKNVKK